MLKIKNVLFALPVSALLLSVLGTACAELPQITESRIIQPPPGARVAAAYFTVTNTSDQPLVIQGASSDAVSHASLHLSSVVDDIAQMEEQDSVTINAGESLEFKQGSYHVMLMGLTEPLSAGNNLSIVLDTSEGPLNVSVPIITPDEATAMDDMAKDSMTHDNMNHDNMNPDDMEDAQMQHDRMNHDDAEHDNMKHDGMDDSNMGTKEAMDHK